MIKLTSVISPGSIKSLVAIGAIALSFAAPAGAECAAAQDIGDSFAVAADADLGYLPFELGSPVAEEAASTELAQAQPFEANFPEDEIVVASAYDLD
ncbi:MAG TPA: hypothetical protein VJ501_07710 [Burkholderiaceae bacterium]|nr:hypothetical protein [Burkholderiaceae bacterium]